MSDDDHVTLKSIIEFNKYDLYTKTFDDANIEEDALNEEKLWKYYNELLIKYKLDGILKW